MNPNTYFVEVYKAALYDTHKYLHRQANEERGYERLTDAKRKRVSKMAVYAQRSVSGK